MVDVDMSLTPLKVIRRETCLWTRGPFGLSKDPRPKRCPNIWRTEESKEIKVFVKVEDGSVHHKKYDGHCVKQWIKIPKVIWTSRILMRRSTCQTSSCRESLMKDHVKVKVPNKTPKTFIPSNGVLKWDGVLKFGGKVEGDHAMHFLGWIERPIAWNSV